LEANVSGQSKKRKTADSSLEESPQPKKQVRFQALIFVTHFICPQAKTNTPSVVPTSKPLTINDLPQKCPDPHCQDHLPNPLPPHIFDLFERKHQLTQKERPKALGCHPLTRQLCTAIATVLEPMGYREMSEQQGWPINTDFKKTT
jgi:hypothetical protein